MSEETKRLLKYDLLCAFKDICVFVLIMMGLQVWCYFMYQVEANTVLLVVYVIGTIMIVWGSKDWQVQIRLYVSAGMTRKRIFRVLLIRSGAAVLAGFFIEAVIVFIRYPWLGIKFLALSVFLQIFLWGFGEIAGVLAYQRKKLGQIFMIIGFMTAGILSMGGLFIMENQEDFWSVLLAELSPVSVSAAGVAAAAMLAAGIGLAKRQIEKYMVY